MIFVLHQPAYSSFQSPLRSPLRSPLLNPLRSPPLNPLQSSSGCFRGFSVREMLLIKLISDLREQPFRSRNLNERRPRAIDTQALFIHLIFKAAYDSHLSGRGHFSARNTAEGATGQEQFRSNDNQQNQRRTFSESFKERTQSDQQSSRPKGQEETGYQRSEYRETPHVSRPDMVEVNKARDVLGLKKCNLNTVTEAEVSKAFRRQALKCHPDKVAKEKADESEKIFQNLQACRERMSKFISYRDSCRN